MPRDVKIGYAEFVELFQIEGDDLNDWVHNLAVRANGVFVRIPPPDAVLTPQERAALTEHPTGDLTQPALPFPCGIEQLREFVLRSGLSGYLDPFKLLAFVDARRAAEPESGRWPWGSHETAKLRNLADAAREFWSTYDPADRTTAPKNEDVSKWLHDKRGETQRMADAIATLLRPDDLPTGPRT